MTAISVILGIQSRQRDKGKQAHRSPARVSQIEEKERFV